MVAPNELYLGLITTNFLISTNLVKPIKLRIMLPTQDCLYIKLFTHK